MSGRPDAIDPVLAAAMARDDVAEDAGMHADDRETCWQCKSWADHAHATFSNERITLDEYEARAWWKR